MDKKANKSIFFIGIETVATLLYAIKICKLIKSRLEFEGKMTISLPKWQY